MIRGRYASTVFQSRRGISSPRCTAGRATKACSANADCGSDQYCESVPGKEEGLCCDPVPVLVSRYLVELGKHAEEHKSSGFWIGPAAGSTAAQRSAGGKVLPLGSKALQLVVREPYTPQGNRYALLRKLVRPGERLVVRSKMRSAAIFLDGPDEVVHVAYGDVVEFTRSDQPLCLLGISPRRGRASW